MNQFTNQVNQLLVTSIINQEFGMGSRLTNASNSSSSNIFLKLISNHQIVSFEAP